MNKFNILFLSILVFGCGIKKSIPQNGIQNQEEIQFNESVNQFGFELFKTINTNEGNSFFSPISISSAMAMAYLGADGETEKEFQTIMHFGSNSSVFHKRIEENTESISSADSINLFRITNSIWLQQDFNLKNDYTDNLKTYYGGNFYSVDFIDDSNREQSRERINEWVKKETNDKIKDIIPYGTLTAQTRTVLVNAVYFFGQWNQPFKEKRNTQMNFFTDENSSVKTTFMNNTQKVSYYENEEIQCIEIPYRGNKFSLFAALAKDKVSGNWYNEKFTIDDFLEVQDSFKNFDVDISLPKFKMETSYQLIPYFQEMGMQEAFTNKADFSRMREKNDLKITDVIHKAFVEVNEKGTEAAAATAVVMGVKSAMISPEKKTFVADHPFMFMILEKETNTILFMGEFSKP